MRVSAASAVATAAFALLIQSATAQLAEKKVLTLQAARKMVASKC